ncbi:MAG: tetraacyldisaccharide 4'-kinase [Bdellovibrionales bacterium]
MKAPAFWYKKRSVMGTLLAPLGVLYRTGALLRRTVSSSAHSHVPLICVGNIVVGGAGKTPTALAIARYLKQQGAQPVFVTRGYGGRKKGPLRVDPKVHTANDVGDEALLLASVAPCWIGRSRPQAIRFASQEGTHIILDDGLQNPTIAPDISLLVIDGAVGFGNRHLFPAGPLRETLHDAFSRVDAIVMIGQDSELVTHCLGKTVLKASLKPSLPKAFADKPNVLAFAGIGRPQKFYDSCAATGLNVIKTQDFADHYAYTNKDLEKLAKEAAHKELSLITTAKDWVRLPRKFRHDVGVLHVDLLFENPEELGRILKVR